MRGGSLLWRGALLVGLLLLAAGSLAWALLPRRSTMPPFGTVTRIEVMDDGNRKLRVILALDHLQRVVEFVDGQREGWGRTNDWAGVPIPYLKAEFYNGTNFIGHFGVGPGFFECHRNGDFLSKGASEADCKRFLDLIGLPGYDPDAKPR